MVENFIITQAIATLLFLMQKQKAKARKQWLKAIIKLRDACLLIAPLEVSAKKR